MWQDYIKKIVFALILVGVASLGYRMHGEKLLLFAKSMGGSAKQTAMQSTTSSASSTSASATAGPKERFEEGKHYKKLSAKITSSKEVQQFISEDKNKIQVLEFFSYACFWCQRLHPLMNEWAIKKPDYVTFYRFPVVFHAGWDKLAKAYYMVEQLGKSDTLDKAFFDAVLTQQLNLTDEAVLREFFVKQGIPETTFNEMYNSFAITRAMSRGNELGTAYQIVVSPAVILNMPSGSYFLTAAMVGTEQTMLDVMAFLINKELAKPL